MPRSSECIPNVLSSRQTQLASDPDEDLDLICIRSLHVSHDVSLQPDTQMLIPCRVVEIGKTPAEESDLWITPSAQLIASGLTMPEGPFVCNRAMNLHDASEDVAFVNVFVSNTTEATVVLKANSMLATCSPCDVDEQNLVQFLDEVALAEKEDEDMLFPAASLQNEAVKKPPKKLVLENAHPRSSTSGRAIAFWKILVMAVLGASVLQLHLLR